ncbi:glycosyltransferase family 39 protein [Arcticibacter sp.]|uniref:glycosyltransferase family 39 protein n=1 Tax=Arcticibacter sp. TaxID=1872630 RepID=UPI00388D281C
MPYSFPVEVNKLPDLRPQKPVRARTFLYPILISGILFRLFHFIHDRSLWLDEIYVALNVVSASFLQLTSPLLEYQQKAPIGFLWTVKGSALIFGNQEQALRLMPLLCGVAALLCFVPVCRHWLKPAGQMAAIGIMAFAPPLIYHSVEVKQYSMELLATVLCLWLYIRFHGRAALKARILWGAAGALILWFSFSSVFILTGIGAAVCLPLMLKKDWKSLWKMCLPFSMWFSSFAVHYVLITSKQVDQQWLLYWFRHYNSFMPLPLWSSDSLKWLIQHLYTMLDYPLGLLWNFNTAESTALRAIMKMSFIPIILTLTGAWAFFKTDKPALILVLLPIMLTLAVSSLERYPFFERLLVFLSPLIILLIAKGCDQVIRSLATFRTLQFIIPILLLTGGFAASARDVINPETFGRYKKSYQKEALLYIDRNFQEGDVVYVYWNMNYGYHYYKKAYSLRYKAILGSDLKFASVSPNHYISQLQPELNQLEGKKRVWVVYNKKLWNDIGEIESKPEWYNQSQPGEFLYSELSRRAHEKGNTELDDVNVHLFDFSSAP